MHINYPHSLLIDLNTVFTLSLFAPNTITIPLHHPSSVPVFPNTMHSCTCIPQCCPQFIPKFLQTSPMTISNQCKPYHCPNPTPTCPTTLPKTVPIIFLHVPSDYLQNRSFVYTYVHMFVISSLMLF